MFVNMTIYMCCLFTIYIIYMWILYYTYIYVCVDARYNYILCIVMYILIQIVIEYDSTKLFFRECAFQPFLVLAQHHHFEQFFCWTCCCPYYLHIYILLWYSHSNHQEMSLNHPHLTVLIFQTKIKIPNRHCRDSKTSVHSETFPALALGVGPCRCEQESNCCKLITIWLWLKPMYPL